MILGAFAAGLIVRGRPQSDQIEHGITEIGHFFVPLFFVAVGASVDLSALDPAAPASRFALVTGGLLILAGVAGKLVAGYAPFWFRGNKTVLGVGMVPRGEVGLIFAQMGLASGVFDAGLFGAVTLMVMVTTLLAPPCLKHLLGPVGRSGRQADPMTPSKTSSPKHDLAVAATRHTIDSPTAARSQFFRFGIEVASQLCQAEHRVPSSRRSRT